MDGWESRLELAYPFPGITPHLLDEAWIRRSLDSLLLDPDVLQVVDAEPAQAYPGTAMIILGANFSPIRADNLVEVGGKPAFVVESSPDRLLVITDATCGSGPIRVVVGGQSADAPVEFLAKPWPDPDSTDLAPPFSFFGRGLPGSGPGGGPLPGGGAAPGSIPPTGTARILVVLTNPTDSVPANPAAKRNDVVSTFGNVTTFYDQVSYGTLDVQVDVTDFVALLGDVDHYHRSNGATGYPNIDGAVLPQLTAEAAQGAVDQGFDLDDYSVMAVLVHLPGLEVRAWGGWSQQSFAFNNGNGVAINLVAANPLSMIAAGHDADWGRAAHEFGHSLVDSGQVLGEDVYTSDLVDPAQATAQMFEMMGSHDSHPMFSGLFMQQLGYYGAANVREIQWDRNPFQEEFEVVAHGAAVDTAADRHNLIRIKVSPGLDYYVEVRQQPPAGSPQVYDTNIPIPTGSTRRGGVIVTKAITGELDNNQQTRLITLLHDPTVLLTGGVATDPLRSLKVTVLNDQVSTNPLVCRVRIEWAQTIGDTPGGDFDLSITPWGPGYESVDIWIDRSPVGTFDFTDAAGNPTGNGDEPRPLEINRFYARVRNTGVAASNVRLTYYSVTPPGVGDNGTWTPLQTKVLPSVPANGTAEEFVNWTPIVGEHTCLKVIAEPQLGEVSVGNNSAQENVFHFQPAGASVPEPVRLPIAVRNPRNVDVRAEIRLIGVPDGYLVYLPHRWVRLAPLGEARMDLLIVPTSDLKELRADMDHVRRQWEGRADPAARIRVSGQIEHGYTEKIDGTGVPGSWYSPIGGIAVRVEPKHLADVRIDEDPEHKGDPRVIGIRGVVNPATAGQPVRVDVRGSDGFIGSAVATTGPRGSLHARIELDGRADTTSARESRPSSDRVGDAVRYTVHAHIINAPDLAPTSSNTVRITRERG